MSTDIKPSLEELLMSASNIMLTGAGATDVVNGIPIANHAKNLGMSHKQIFFGGLACQWWDSSTAAPDYYQIEALRSANQISPTAAEVTEETTVIRDDNEHIPPETVFVKQFDYQSVVFDGNHGVQGLVNGLEKYVKENDIDLIIHVDCGSDSLYDGELGKVETPLHDYLMMAAVNQVNIPSIHALTGYGLDGEMPMDALNETVANLMRNSVYIGAHGIKQRDIQDLELANKHVDDPINSLVLPAALGDHSDKEVFGRQIEVGPLAATILLFDLCSLVNHGPASKLEHTNSLEDAERNLINQGITPETQT